jgi:phosphomannomutase
MKKKLILLDVDGTITNSGCKIDSKMENILILLSQNFELGIVGGGKIDKIIWQLENIKEIFLHYFTECGCVYYKNEKSFYFNLNEIYRKNIRNHPLYNKINILIKLSLNFISNVDYIITGNFIDLRSGIIYISLIGMDANEDERKNFIELETKFNYRQKLILLLQKKAVELDIENKIHIVLGGSVGIAIYPSEFDKKQIMNHINANEYNEIHYFGDKYKINGNDFNLLNHENIIGHKVNSLDETFISLTKLNSNNLS